MAISYYGPLSPAGHVVENLNTIFSSTTQSNTAGGGTGSIFRTWNSYNYPAFGLIEVYMIQNIVSNITNVNANITSFISIGNTETGKNLFSPGEELISQTYNYSSSFNQINTFATSSAASSYYFLDVLTATSSLDRSEFNSVNRKTQLENGSQSFTNSSLAYSNISNFNKTIIYGTTVNQITGATNYSYTSITSSNYNYNSSIIGINTLGSTFSNSTVENYASGGTTTATGFIYNYRGWKSLSPVATSYTVFTISAGQSLSASSSTITTTGSFGSTTFLRVSPFVSGTASSGYVNTTTTISETINVKSWSDSFITEAESSFQATVPTALLSSEGIPSVTTVLLSGDAEFISSGATRDLYIVANTNAGEILWSPGSMTRANFEEGVTASSTLVSNFNTYSVSLEAALTSTNSYVTVTGTNYCVLSESYVATIFDYTDTTNTIEFSTFSAIGVPYSYSDSGIETITIDKTVSSSFYGISNTYTSVTLNGALTAPAVIASVRKITQNGVIMGSAGAELINFETLETVYSTANILTSKPMVFTASNVIAGATTMRTYTNNALNLSPFRGVEVEFIQPINSRAQILDNLGPGENEGIGINGLEGFYEVVSVGDHDLMIPLVLPYATSKQSVAGSNTTKWSYSWDYSNRQVIGISEVYNGTSISSSNNFTNSAGYFLSVLPFLSRNFYYTNDVIGNNISLSEKGIIRLAGNNRITVENSNTTSSYNIFYTDKTNIPIDEKQRIIEYAWMAESTLTVAAQAFLTQNIPINPQFNGFVTTF